MIRAYSAQFRITLKEDLLNLWADAVPSSIVIFMHILVVIAVYAAAQQTTFYGTFTWPMIVWYLIITQVIVGMGKNIIREVNDDVQTGMIAAILARPYAYPLGLYTTFIGSTIVETSVTLLIAVPFGIIVAGPIIGPMAVLCGTLLILMAITMHFLISLCLGLSAFWTEDAHPYSWIYNKLIFIMGGLFFPLDVFPPAVSAVAKILPPAFIMYYPAKLIVDFSWQQFWYVLAVQAAYVLVLAGIAAYVYSKAIKKVNLNGG